MSTGFAAPIASRTGWCPGAPAGRIAGVSPFRDWHIFIFDTTPGAVVYTPVLPAQFNRAKAIFAPGGMVTDAFAESNVPASLSTSDHRRKKSSPILDVARFAASAQTSGPFPVVTGAWSPPTGQRRTPFPAYRKSP